MCLLASQGPFGPTVPTCLLFVVAMAAPFVFVLLSVRSFLNDDPTPSWVLALMLIGNVTLGYFFWPFDFPERTAKGLVVWWIVAVAAMVAFPLVLLYEANKRGWFRRRNYDD